MKAKSDRMPGRDRRPQRGDVWDVYDPMNGGHTGYLVTEAGNINRPLTYIDCASGSTKEALAVAGAIAADPRNGQPARIPDGLFVDDLSAGIRWSWYVYGLCCLPLGTAQRDGVEYSHPRPYSDALLREILAAADVAADAEARGGGARPAAGGVVVLAGVETRLRRTPLPLFVNGVDVGFFADAQDREILVRDDGNADALVERSVKAAAAYLEGLLDESPAENRSGRPNAPDDAPEPGSTESGGGTARPAA